MDFRDYSIIDLVKKIKGKEVSAHEVTSSAIANIETKDKLINAFCAVKFEEALTQADDIDKRIRKGEDVGPLAGIPIGVKDLEDAKTKGRRITI